MRMPATTPGIHERYVARTLINELASRGICLLAHGGKIHCMPAGAIKKHPTLLELLHKYKHAVSLVLHDRID